MTKEEVTALVGANLRKYREANNLTQDELAEQAGISTSFYANIERGKKGMSLPVLRNLAEALKISADFLLFDSAPRSRLQNIYAMLKDQPEHLIAAMERLIRVCLDEFTESR